MHQDARSSSAPGEARARRSRGSLALVPREIRARHLQGPLALVSALALVPVIALGLVASGCGSSSTETAAPAAVQTHSVPRPVAAAPPRLSILSPRAGAHTSSTLTVRVALQGAPGGGARFKYVLDRSLTRLGLARLTFHDLAPGHHRLQVFLVRSAASPAAVAFTVHPPAPVAVPTPAPMQTAPTMTESTPPPPPAATTTAPAPAPAPAPAKTTPAPPSEGIPQGGGGDGDGDNSGAPSDGDGNI
jgi:hypothetical protein